MLQLCLAAWPMGQSFVTKGKEVSMVATIK